MNRRSFAQMLAGALLAPALRPLSVQAQPSPAMKGVRLSFMLWALTKQASFDRSLEIVSSAGYQGVELTGQFQQWSPQEHQRILGRLQSLKLVVDSMSGLKAGFAVPSETDAFLTQFAEHLQYAKRLQCPQVILLSGNRVAGLPAEQQHSTATENVKRAAEMAAKESIEVVIEPIDYLENPKIFMASVSEGFSIAEAVNAPNVKVLYDLYHEQRSFGNLIEKLEANIARIGLIHVADVPGRHEPGTGEIDYTIIYRKLAQLRYDRWIAMEYYPTTEPVASLTKARVDLQQAMAGS